MSFVTAELEMLAVAAGNSQGSSAVAAPTSSASARCEDAPDPLERTGYGRRVGCGRRHLQCGCSWVRIWR